MSKWGFSLLSLVLLFIKFPSSSYATGSQNYPEGVVTPDGPAQMQTFKINVTGSKEAKPKVIWVQSDGPLWKATWEGGFAETGTELNEKNETVPKKKRTDFILNMNDYAPNSMQDSKGTGYPRDDIKNFAISKMSWINVATYKPAETLKDPEF